jgi:hypothetical protein
MRSLNIEKSLPQIILKIMEFPGHLPLARPLRLIKFKLASERRGP